MKVIELFAGIGSPRKALEKLNIHHEYVAFSEVDRFAVDSYRAIHNDFLTPNFGDIEKIKELPETDLLIYGSPCQDISIAGKHQGIQEGTRSGLLLEVLRLLENYKKRKKLPKYLFLENVANILSKNHRWEFQNYLVFLEKLGYKNFYKVLNALNYEIPQNRERLFCLSIFDDKKYNFPGPKKLNILLKDLLEKQVDEKYFINEEKTKAFIEKYKDKILEMENLEKVNLIGSLSEKNSQGERVYMPDVSVTLSSQGGGLGAKTGLYLIGEVGTGGQRGRVYSPDGCMPCLTSTDYKDPQKIFIDYRIRRLTPRECFRLMGFTDNDFDKVKAIGMSDTQLYKQAGNSMVVNVPKAIFKSLFLEEEIGEYKLF